MMVTTYGYISRMHRVVINAQIQTARFTIILWVQDTGPNTHPLTNTHTDTSFINSTSNWRNRMAIVTKATSMLN